MTSEPSPTMTMKLHLITKLHIQQPGFLRYQQTWMTIEEAMQVSYQIPGTKASETRSNNTPAYTTRRMFYYESLPKVSITKTVDQPNKQITQGPK